MRPERNRSKLDKDRDVQDPSVNRPGHRRPIGAGRWIFLSALLVLGMLCFPVAPQALILDEGDGTGNTAAPQDDPGWRNVGHHLGSPSVVYLGNQWILTTEHSGLNSVLFEGRRYNPVPGSLLRVEKPETQFADLLLFRIDEDPGLPALSMSTSPPKVGEHVMLIAAGSSRGGRFTFYSQDSGPLDGFTWQADQTKRWGTNRVEAAPSFVGHRETSTMAFPMVFNRIEDPGSTRHEAAGALGDSGGALFARENPKDPDSDWVLSGIVFSVTSRGEGLQRITFYSDVTWAADLSYYRDRIMKHMQEYRPQNPPDASPPLDSASGPSRLREFAGLATALLVVAMVWRRLRRPRSSSQSDR